MKSLHPFQRIALLSAIAIAANSLWLFASTASEFNIGTWTPPPPENAEIIYIYVTYPQQLPCN